MLLGRMLVESETPGSTHDCAQISLVLAGEFDLTVGSETRRLVRGDAFYVPASVFHRVVKVVTAPVEIIDVWPVSGPAIPK